MKKDRAEALTGNLIYDNESALPVVGKPVLSGSTLRIPILYNGTFDYDQFVPYPWPDQKGDLHGFNFIFEDVHYYQMRLSLYLWYSRKQGMQYREKVVTCPDINFEGFGPLPKRNFFEVGGLTPQKNWECVDFVIAARSMEIEAPKGNFYQHMGPPVPTDDVTERPTKWDRFKAVFVEPPLPWDDGQTSASRVLNAWGGIAASLIKNK
ncbi:hypothetical protein RYZ26_19155 [Terasakiella sp. A23]|uniref:hypothetical protein n=1 Tax=Terasakiella sp. FCG-A23 TaxID=3080561 RepID=UPI002953164F|nr:hypothetical protein [Terasakiella sp. A23]MDV7341728.1 hypothetical protein [Terasakiella sp. A23]